MRGVKHAPRIDYSRDDVESGHDIVDPVLVGGIALEQAVRDLLQGFSQLDLDW
jgi:hypothetical protein